MTNSIKCLDLVVLYAPGQGFEITGSAQSLFEFADYLGKTEGSSIIQLSVPVGGDPSPYDIFCLTLRVEVGTSLAEIVENGGALLIKGNKASLAGLARSVEFLAQQRKIPICTSSIIWVTFFCPRQPPRW